MKPMAMSVDVAINPSESYMGYSPIAT